MSTEINNLETLQEEEQKEEKVEEKTEEEKEEERRIKREKREKRRLCVVNEILSSENTYVNRLRTTVDVFIIPLREKNILTNDEFKKQFGNLEIIRELHERLLQALTVSSPSSSSITNPPSTTTMPSSTSSTTTPSSTSSSPSPSTSSTTPTHISSTQTIETLQIGKIFKEFSAFLKMYKEYLAFYEGGIVRLAKLVTTNRKFVEFLEKSRADPRCLGMGIDSFLMEPVQRIPRYRMLLEELLKYTSEDNEDHANIAIALENVDFLSLFLSLFISH